MSRIAYVNGRYLPHHSATVHVEDRGYQFSDGVYEVAAICDGRIIDETGHLKRLKRSLKELRISMPMKEQPLKAIFQEIIRRNRIDNGIFYLQITRGVARRDHPFPNEETKPGLVLTARSTARRNIGEEEKGIQVVTTRDIRWLRRDIKSISLLPNILAKQKAREKGVYEAWFVDDSGLITEGSSTNAWIVDKNGSVITRQLGPDILGGITRDTVISLAKQNGITILERPFTMDEAIVASEAFITSTTSFVTSVVGINENQIGNGKPGPVTKQLQKLYLNYCYNVGSNH